jgi:hypothetical protein
VERIHIVSCQVTIDGPRGVLLYALEEASRSRIKRSDMNSEFALGKYQIEVCGLIVTRNARSAVW